MKTKQTSECEATEVQPVLSAFWFCTQFVQPCAMVQLAHPLKHGPIVSWTAQERYGSFIGWVQAYCAYSCPGLADWA